MTAPGNHEVENTPNDAQYPGPSNSWNNALYATRFANYLARYPAPQTMQQVRKNLGEDVGGPWPLCFAKTLPLTPRFSTVPPSPT